MYVIPDKEIGTRTVADELTAGLLRHGVTHIFGQSLPSLLLLSAERAGIRQVVYRTENAGGTMADGFARASQRVGVVAAQNGPAATLLVPPLSEALKSSIPLVALVQDVPTAARDRNAFQELDHAALFAGCTKWVRRIDTPEAAAFYLDAAFTAATSGRPGPVVLLLPKDVLAASLPVDGTRAATRRAAMPTYPLDRPRPDALAVREAARLLGAAARPLVIAGGGVHGSAASAELARLQEIASLPVATTSMGKGAVDEGHPLSVGVIGQFMGENGATRYHSSLVHDADVILLVGTRTNENGTDSWKLLPPSATYIHIDIDAAEIGRNYEALRLTGDARAALQDLTDQLLTTPLARRDDQRRQLESVIADGRRLHEAESARVTTSAASPIRPERVMAELDRLLTPDMIVVSDASYSSIWTANFLRARRSGQRFLSPRGLAGLGWGLPLALGAQVAQPDTRVVCITGDGGFAHVWAELETAVRERLPVTVVLLNNSVLGYQKHAELFQFDAYTSAIDLGPVDHAAIAEACGARGVRVTDPAQLAGVLVRALGDDRPTLVEVITDPEALPPISSWAGHSERILTNPSDRTAS